MMGISLKSKVPSPSRFALTIRKQSQNDNKNPPQPMPSPQHSTFPLHFLIIVELRHTEVWTRDHLEWFNVDFDYSRFHNIPVAFSSSVQLEISSQGNFMSTVDYLEHNELLAREYLLLNEYRK